jgi:hypothetical protein
MGSPLKTLVASKKNKGKEKVPKPRKESFEHINFHSSSKSSEDVHSLILLLDGPKRRKGSNQALEHLEVDKFPQTREEASPKVN